MIAIPKRQIDGSPFDPDFLGSRIRGGNMVRGGICCDFVRPPSMRPLLERLLLTYAVGAIFTLLMQTYGRFDQCVGIVACTFSLGKGVVWSTIWPVAWIIGPGSELTLTMRLTGHGPGVYKDGIDYGKTSARASRMIFGFSGRCTALC
jgi:hypothetical protein